MKDLPNIEKSAFRPKQYVGYSFGVWYIRRVSTSYGNWSARRMDGAKMTNDVLFAHTLTEMSKKLLDFTPTPQ